MRKTALQRRSGDGYFGREFFAGLLLPDHPSFPVLLRVVKASPLARLRRMQESSLANRGSCS